MQAPVPSLPTIGTSLGAKAGLVLSWLYITGITALLLGPEVLRAPLRLTLVPVIVLSLATGCVIGMLPAVLLGSFTGRLLAILVMWLYPQITRDWALLLGLGLCAGITLGLSSFYWLAIVGVSPFTAMAPSDAYTTYYLFLGVPSLLYIGMGGWAGDRLYMLYTRQHRQT